MADYVEGKRPVIEALKTDVPIKKILLADNAKREPMIEDILRKARQRGIQVIEVPRAELDQKSARGSHQGVMAETKPFPYKGVGDIVDPYIIVAGNPARVLRKRFAVRARRVPRRRIPRVRRAREALRNTRAKTPPCVRFA